MKALVYTKPNCMEIQYRKMPIIKHDEALIKIAACGICGSDVHGYMGKTGRRYPPMIMGHEFAGIVKKSSSNIKEGTKVAIEPLVTCGVCKECIIGETQRCKKRRLFGTLDIDGAFCEYMAIPEKLLIPLPNGVNLANGSLAEPLAVAWGAVKKLPKDLSAMNVLVVGAGTIGQLIIQCLKYKNAGTIIVSDTVDYRLELAIKLGADLSINPIKEDIKDVIIQKFPNGVDFSVESVGISATVKQALDNIKIGGTCVWVGLLDSMVNVDMQDVVSKEKTILGTYIYNHKTFIEAIELMSKEPFNISPLISRKISIEEAPQMFELLSKGAGDIIKTVVVF